MRLAFLSSVRAEALLNRHGHGGENALGEQGVQPLQADGVDVKEVGGQETAGLRLEELGPFFARGLSAPPGRLACGAQDTADGGWADGVAEAAELAVHAAEAPAWVLGVEPDDQVAELVGHWWASWWGWLRPLALDQAPMPGEQRAWSDEPMASEGLGQEPGEGGQQRPVRSVWLRRGDLTAQHRDLLAPHEYLSALCRGRPAQQSKPREDPRGEQVDHPYEHDDGSCPTARTTPRSTAVKQFWSATG